MSSSSFGNSKLNDQEVLPASLVDRLIDMEPKKSKESINAASWTWPELIKAIRRDVQGLLNTRMHVGDTQLENCPEAQDSVMTYGFPEFVTANPESIETQRALKAAIEQVLRRFEPRLRNVRVMFVPASASARVAHFRLEAFVNAQPRPRRVVFDTMLDIDRLECTVEELA